MSKSIAELKLQADKDHVAYGNFTLLLGTLINVIESPNGLDFFVSKSSNKGVLFTYIDVIEPLDLNLQISIATSSTHYTLEIYNEKPFQTVLYMKLPIAMRESLIPAFNYILDLKPNE